MGDPFPDEPLSDHEILKSLWKLTTEKVIPQLEVTNGRVTALEKWRWLVTGGLAVVLALAVPIFIDMVSR